MDFICGSPPFFSWSTPTNFNQLIFDVSVPFWLVNLPILVDGNRIFLCFFTTIFVVTNHIFGRWTTHFGRWKNTFPNASVTSSAPATKESCWPWSRACGWVQEGHWSRSSSRNMVPWFFLISRSWWVVSGYWWQLVLNEFLFPFASRWGIWISPEMVPYCDSRASSNYNVKKGLRLRYIDTDDLYIYRACPQCTYACTVQGYM